MILKEKVVLDKLGWKSRRFPGTGNPGIIVDSQK